MIIRKKDDDNHTPSGGTGSSNENSETSKNKGTVILDATCAPQNIAFPQDTRLLNECREKLEGVIDYICEKNALSKPRMYRRKARKDYLSIARTKKKTAGRIRKAIKKQLQYVQRDFAYIGSYLEQGYTITEKQKTLLTVLHTLYNQQKYMYDNKTHIVPDRIVSISQPYIRPIVRGKAKAKVEFGAKLDISIVDGYARIEKQSFDAYNESEVLKEAVEGYAEKYGHYPEKVLADKIYRNRDNLKYCKLHGIQLSGPALGRSKRGAVIDKKAEYKDNCDRVEVERAFSLAKRSYGLGLIRTRLEDTTRSVIALSILAMNLNKVSLRQIFYSVILGYRTKIRVVYAGF